MSERGVSPVFYKGIDINKRFIDICSGLYPENDFEARDILKEPFSGSVADIGVMFGVMNFNFKEVIDNMAYARNFITRAFFSVRECLIVDMLSDRLSGDYDKEDFVFYYAPEEMLRFCLSLTDNVVLKHDYRPIPQKEFMLILKR